MKKVVATAEELFVGNLQWAVTEEDLKSFFSKYGDLASVKLLTWVISFFTPRQYGKSQGKGFVTYKNVADAVKAKAADGAELKGRKINVRPALEPRKFTEQPENKPVAQEPTAFIGNLSFSTTKETIEKFFQPCGKILEVKIPLDFQGRQKGLAFIKFESADGVKKAIALTGKELDGRTLRIEESHPREGGYSRRRFGRRFRRGGFRRGGYRRGGYRSREERPERVEEYAKTSWVQKKPNA